MPAASMLTLPAAAPARSSRPRSGRGRFPSPRLTPAWWTWRQLALRLLPLAAVMLLAAIVALTTSSTSNGSFRELEHEALGTPVALDNRAEPVLSIAFEPFPEEIP